MSCVVILAVGLEVWKPAGRTDLPGDHTFIYILEGLGCLEPQGCRVTEPRLGLAGVGGGSCDKLMLESHHVSRTPMCSGFLGVSHDVSEAQRDQKIKVVFCFVLFSQKSPPLPTCLTSNSSPVLALLQGALGPAPSTEIRRPLMLGTSSL